MFHLPTVHIKGPLNMTITTLPDAIFWDWDGTIVDSYSYLEDAHNYTLEKLGLATFKENEYRNYFGKPRDILYPAIYKEQQHDAMELFQNYVFKNAHKIQIIDGCAEVLKLFHDKGIQMGIVSNKKANFIEEELKHTNFQTYFTNIIGAGEAEADKPSAAPLLLALSQCKLNTEQHNIWYFGDTENDLACAKEANVDCLFFNENASHNNLINQYKPLFTFENYKELHEFLVAI